MEINRLIVFGDGKNKAAKFFPNDEGVIREIVEIGAQFETTRCLARKSC